VRVVEASGRAAIFAACDVPPATTRSGAGTWRERPRDLAALTITPAATAEVAHATRSESQPQPEIAASRSRVKQRAENLRHAFVGRHLRSNRVLCLSDGSAMTRDRVIKAVRGAQRVAGVDQGWPAMRTCRRRSATCT